MASFLPILADYTFQTVALGTALLGAVCGLLGCFCILRRESLIGDGISHAALFGVAAVFLFCGQKSTPLLLFGALVAGLLCCLMIFDAVRHTPIRFDAALAVYMSAFFGAGLILLTHLQKQPQASQAGLSRFIYGQAAALSGGDVQAIVLTCLGLLAILLAFWKEFKALSFDATFATTTLVPAALFGRSLSLLTVVAIIVGLQCIGVVLMSALLIAPAVAARQWCASLERMALLAAFIGGVSGFLGSAVSVLFPDLPTGAAIVLCASTAAALSLLLAPERGIIHKALKRRALKNRLQKERA